MSKWLVPSVGIFVSSWDGFPFSLGIGPENESQEVDTSAVADAPANGDSDSTTVTQVNMEPQNGDVPVSENGEDSKDDKKNQNGQREPRSRQNGDDDVGVFYVDFHHCRMFPSTDRLA